MTKKHINNTRVIQKMVTTHINTIEQLAQDTSDNNIIDNKTQ